MRKKLWGILGYGMGSFASAYMERETPIWVSAILTLRRQQNGMQDVAINKRFAIVNHQQRSSRRCAKLAFSCPNKRQKRLGQDGSNPK